tara:strand:- start:1077 stop:1277 length:201 start_codon:yes stop_codon:yes gene_type:complete
MKRKGESKMVVKLMTQDTKDRIRDLERQKIDLEDRLELFTDNNLVKMVEIENEIFEIEDTIKKLTG